MMDDSHAIDAGLLSEVFSVVGRLRDRCDEFFRARKVLIDGRKDRESIEIAEYRLLRLRQATVAACGIVERCKSISEAIGEGHARELIGVIQEYSSAVASWPAPQAHKTFTLEARRRYLLECDSGMALADASDRIDAAREAIKSTVGPLVVSRLGDVLIAEEEKVDEDFARLSQHERFALIRGAIAALHSVLHDYGELFGKLHILPGEPEESPGRSEATKPLRRPETTSLEEQVAFDVQEAFELEWAQTAYAMHRMISGRGEELCDALGREAAHGLFDAVEWSLDVLDSSHEGPARSDDPAGERSWIAVELLSSREGRVQLEALAAAEKGLIRHYAMNHRWYETGNETAKGETHTSVEQVSSLTDGQKAGDRARNRRTDAEDQDALSQLRAGGPFDREMSAPPPLIKPEWDGRGALSFGKASLVVPRKASAIRELLDSLSDSGWEHRIKFQFRNASHRANRIETLNRWRPKLNSILGIEIGIDGDNLRWSPLKNRPTL
ncbi:MAG: hypothetical protein KDA61_08885 [Planctomycetales bacterium]|nr:hypothetical protein [Planctomycetales bacterium]